MDICRNLSDILTDLGYQVDFAHDGPSALELVRQRPYDVALLDLKMPGMDGLTLYREIKKQRAGDGGAAGHGLRRPRHRRGGARGRGVEGPRQAGRLPRRCSGWSTRRSASRWSWSSTTTATSAPTSGTCSASAATASAWRTTAARRPTQLQESTFKVVLIDMRIPDGDGGAVFRMVREANPQARTVLITGYRSEMDQLVEQVLAEGADAVCYKPFDVPELLETLEQLAEAHARRGPATARAEIHGRARRRWTSW